MMSSERDADQRSSYSSRLSSAPSVLSDNMEVEPEEGPNLWNEDVQVDWQDKCLQLELSLQKFRDQAGKIRELLREKEAIVNAFYQNTGVERNVEGYQNMLAELEHRVIEAESRAEEAEEKVRMMEQKFSESKWTPTEAQDKYSQLQSAVKEKDHMITKLETQVEEQKKLRLHDAKQVETKAARIKEWVTNKLKELEEQNQHLREQNQKCNKQLQLLKNRLDNLPSLDSEIQSRKRASTEDSSRGSFEERPDSDESLPAEISQSASPSGVQQRRVNSSSGESGCRQGSSHSEQSGSGSGLPGVDSDTDPLYAEVDYARKNLRRAEPPKVRVERKKFHDSQLSFSSSPASEELGSDAELVLSGGRCPRFDSGSVDMETPPMETPRSPLTPSGGAGLLYPSIGDEDKDDCHSLAAAGRSSSVSGNLCRRGLNANVVDPSTSSMVSSAEGTPKRKPVPPPRSRLPAKKALEASSSVDHSLEDLRCQLEVALSLDSIENLLPVVGGNGGGSSSSTTPPPQSSHAVCGGGGGKLGTSGIPRDHHPSERLTARVADEDECHDYAEIYTPSKERLPQWNGDNQTDANKPPTPPLHRFPSWESRIYEIANNGIVLDDGLTNGNHSDSTNNNKPANGTFAQTSQVYPDINIPVYATVKGRASQIRSMPFTGESSDSSDNEDTRVTMTTASSHTTSGETESSLSTSSPSKSLKGCSSPSLAKPNCSSPSKPFRRDASVESTLSDDYTIPPDAVSTDALSIDSSVEPKSCSKANVQDSPKKESLEKSGYLTKLGGKLKTWRKRWFVLKNGTLTYFKSQSDIHRKPQGQITLDEVCHVTRADGAATFEISTSKKTYYLTADSIATMEDWVRVLQNVLRRNATKLLLSKEENKPTITGWLVKVKHGHSKRCWCVLIGKMFLYFKTPNDTTPLGQINMRDSRVEEVEHVSDSDEEDHGSELKGKRIEFTVGIFPNHQGPTYLLMSSKQEKDTWLYHLTVVSGGSSNVGTQYEQLVQRLMEMGGDPNCVIWRHPLLLYSKDNITQPLTTLPSEQLQTEAVKLFKSCQLFMSVLVDSAGIDYHVVLAQNALQQCLTLSELQNELYCQLIKQTSKHTQQKLGMQSPSGYFSQLLLCATQSLFLCDSSGAEKTSPTSNAIEQSLPPLPDCKMNPANFVFVQGWQLLALAVSLFLPRNSRLLWYLHLHLQRNANAKSEIGKYAIFCQRALERIKKNGGRDSKPSRMEVLSILLKNPYHHSLPHSIPVHFLNGSYQVVGFDGSTTVSEFIRTLNQEIGVRDVSISGFALSSDDPIDSNLEHCLRGDAKLCDVISMWETALRENKLGKFENTKVIKLTYKNRFYFRNLIKTETEKERLLSAFQINEEIVNDRFPVSKELALELAALLAQVELGDCHSDRGRSTPSSPGHQLHQVFERFFPKRIRESSSPDELKQLSECLAEKWSALKGRSILDCVRIYVNCTRKWHFFGAKLFPAKLKTTDQSSVWLAVNDEGISLLDYATMHPITKYSYDMMETFGGCKEDFMLVVVHQTEVDKAPEGRTEKHLFGMTKPMILELTLLTADYMNALGKLQVPGTPAFGGGGVSRADSRVRRLRSGRMGEPDLVKMAIEMESRLQRSDSRKCSSTTPAHCHSSSASSAVADHK